MVAGSFIPNARFHAISPEEKAATETGVTKVLKKVFPLERKVQRSIVQSIMTCPDRALYRPKHFHALCWHMYMDKPTEGSLTKALEGITPDTRERFFLNMEKNRKKGFFPLSQSFLRIGMKFLIMMALANRERNLFQFIFVDWRNR